MCFVQEANAIIIESAVSIKYLFISFSLMCSVEARKLYTQRDTGSEHMALVRKHDIRSG